MRQIERVDGKSKVFWFEGGAEWFIQNIRTTKTAGTKEFTKDEFLNWKFLSIEHLKNQV